MISNEERKAFLAKLKEEGIFYIIDADEKYRDDKIIMKGLVKINGGLLGVASDRLKKDPEIINEALNSKNDHIGTSNGRPYGFAIEYVDREYLKSHVDLILNFLSKNMESASILGDEILFSIREVYEYVLSNIDKNTFLWVFLPSQDRYSKPVVMKVINDMPNMIGELPADLQCDVDVVIEAARGHHPDFNAVYAMYGHMNEEAQKNPDVCRTLIDIDPRVFPILKYKDDYIIKKGLNFNGDYLGILGKEEKANKEYVLIAVSQNGLALDCADSKFKDDEDVVYTAISNNGWAINLASKRLSENPKMINKALDVSPELATYGWKRPTNNKR